MMTDVQHPQPKPERPLAARIAFHARAKHDVARKLWKYSPLSEEDWPLSPALRAHFAPALQHYLTDTKWTKTLSFARPELHAAITDIARETIEEYVSGFELRGKIMRQLSAAPSDETNRKRVCQHRLDIYLNHISNLTELRLQEIGLDPVSSHLTHSAMIGASLGMFDSAVAVRDRSQSPPTLLHMSLRPSGFLRPEFYRPDTSEQACRIQSNMIARLYRDERQKLGRLWQYELWPDERPGEVGRANSGRSAS